MAIVCRQCGRSNADGAQFCANPACGAYLGWDGERSTTPAPEWPAPPRPEPRPEQHAAAALALADPTLPVEPGATTGTTATVHNGGSQVEQFVLTVAGPAARWAEVEPAALTIYPGERAECAVRVAPPRTSEAPAGRAPFTVRASTTVRRGLAATADGWLELAPFRLVSATLNPERSSGRRRTLHRVEVTNAGNVVEPVAVQASDRDGRVRFDTPGGELAAAPGQRMINVAVRPPFRLAGRARSYPFQVVVIPHPPAPPVRLDGDRRARAFLSGWVAVLVVVLMLLACLGCCSNSGWKLNLSDGVRLPVGAGTTSPTHSPVAIT